MKSETGTLPAETGLGGKSGAKRGAWPAMGTGLCAIAIFAAQAFPKASANVADVVAKALAFKAMLSAPQQAVLEQSYTLERSHKWSNLPVGSVSRNGVGLGTLNGPQLAAALDLIAAVSGKGSDQGFEEFVQTTMADSFLAVSRPGGYGKGLYFLAFLNTPSTTGKWMLQFGGHHYAGNISFDNGAIIGTTPAFRGIEPTVFATAGGTNRSPLKKEKTAFADLIASLTLEQAATAKLATGVNDLVAGAGKDGAFPSQKSGIKLGALTALQRQKALAAMDFYFGDLDSATAAAQHALCLPELAETYLAYSGQGTFNANNDYIRLDGPNVWIEFLSLTSGSFPSQMHYHTIWRDRSRDYGNDLKGGPLVRSGSRTGPSRSR